MMGFGEEAGVIPRFCRELFSRLASMENEEVKCHLIDLQFLLISSSVHFLIRLDLKSYKDHIFTLDEASAIKHLCD